MDKHWDAQGLASRYIVRLWRQDQVFSSYQRLDYKS